MRLTHHRSLFGCCAALALCLPTPSQDRAAGDGTAEEFVLDVGRHAIVALVKKASTFLGQTLLIDVAQAPHLSDSESAGATIDVPRKLSLDRTAFEEVLSQLMASKGWYRVTLDEGRAIYEWIWVQGPKSSDIKRWAKLLPPGKCQQRPNLVEYVVTTAPVEHVNPQQLCANLRTFFNDPRGLVQLIPCAMHPNGGGALMISGLRPEVCLFLEMIENIDKPGKHQPALEQRVEQLEQRLKALEAERAKSVKQT